MKAYWLGKTDPPEGLRDIHRVDAISGLSADSLVFVDDQSFVAWKDINGQRVYIVSDLPISAPLPENISGVIPRDLFVIESITRLYSEMRESYDLSDKLIRSLNEKELAIQEKQAIMLRDSRRYKAIIKNASDFIVVLGPAGRIMFCNDTLKQYMGRVGHSLIGVPFTDLVVEGDTGQIQEMIDKNFSKAVPSKAEARFNLASGKEGIFSLMSTPLIEEDHIYAVSIIGRDITDLRTLQGRLTVQANDLTSMINGLSHELRNPLTVIGAYIKRLQQQEVAAENSEKRERAVAGILTSIRRIEDMVQRIERYESIANMDAYYREVNLRQLMGDLLKNFVTDVPVEMEECEDVWAYTDPDHVKIAVRRILENAVDTATPTIKIHISEHKMHAYIVVRDFGCGIRESAEAIFGPFFSSDPMKVGLGLTEARIAMVKIDGEIEVEPQADPGTIFIIKVPTDRRHRTRN